MTEEKGIWEEQPVYSIPFLNCEPSAVVDYVQKNDAWLEKLKPYIKRLERFYRVINEFVEPNTPDMILLPETVLQIFNTAMEKAEKWDKLDQPAKYNLTKYMECSDKLEAIETFARLRGKTYMSQKIFEILGVDG